MNLSCVLHRQEDFNLEIEINPLDFNPKYPKYPHTLGEKLRKARIWIGREVFSWEKYKKVN